MGSHRSFVVLLSLSIVVSMTAPAASQSSTAAPEETKAGGAGSTVGPTGWEAIEGAERRPHDARRLAPMAPAAGDTPGSANPWLAQLPAGVTPDYAYWQGEMARQAGERPSPPTAFGPQALVAASESESPTQRGMNDTVATADPIGGFGVELDPQADVTGALPGSTINVPNETGGVALDGTRATATATGLTAGTSVFAIGTIGESGNPHNNAGTGTGDFDWFRVDGVTAGRTLHVDVTTLLAFDSDLDPAVAVYDSAATRVAVDDDSSARGYDSELTYTAAAAGTHYVVVRGFNSGWQSDVDDAGSGVGSGANSQGLYALSVGLDAVVDRDLYSFPLRAGDVLGAALDGANLITVYDPAGAVLVDTLFSNAGAYPASSPLPAGSFSDLAFVAPQDGTYTVGVRTGAGAYTLKLRAFAPGLATAPDNATTTLFVDFDGAVIDTSIFGAGGAQPRTLSPLSSFLPNWGLGAGAEDEVIDAILAIIEEGLHHDLAADGRAGDRDTSGVAGELDIEILNSRDHPDPFGDPHVSRLVIGGTISESGISTIGIAQSIDVGNYGSEESALVLLDLLSAPAGNPNSINSVARAAGVTVIDLVGAGVGTIAAHEAGHFFGSWHQDRTNTNPAIMDQGGSLANALGLGPDGTFGTADDVEVDLVDDAYAPAEAFFGSEDTAAATAFALVTGLPSAPARPDAPSGSPRDRAARVEFSPPADDGMSPITGYRVRAFSGDTLVSTTDAASSPVTVSGLANGTSYEFTVAAINAAGASPASPRSGAVIPRTVPGAPLDVAAALGGDLGDVEVSFEPPADDGGRPVTGFTARAYDEAGEVVETATGTESPLVVTGLDAGETFTFTVAATNVAGDGPESAETDELQIGSEPTAPRNLEVVPAAGALIVDFDAPSDDGGVPIEEYVVRAYEADDGATGFQGVAVEIARGDSGPITVDGLTDRVPYVVTVAAVNAVGEGAESPPSDPVAPIGAAAGVTRLDGGAPDVRAVAIDICQYLLPVDDAADRVLLARNDVFADALAGAPLAADEACILFTTGGDTAPLDPAVRTEIDRVLRDGGTVQIMGGELAVSAAVADELQGAGYTVQRFFGASRFETAVAIATEVKAATGATGALLAFAYNWPDAITGGAFGAASGQPILLTETAALHPATAQALTALGLTSTTVLGGTAVVSDEAMAAAPGATRVAGANRMGTAAAVAELLWGSLDIPYERFVLANLEHESAWTLALAAAPLSAQIGAPQLGVGTAFYPDETNGFLEALTFEEEASAIIVGGADLVSAAFEEEIRADIQP